MRAMVIGFPKSGTTTIHRACRRSKLRSAHWKTPEGYCGQLIYKSYRAGRDPFETLADYDVISQADVCKPPAVNYWPQLDFELLDTVRRYHPKCVFILNRREPQKIIESMNRWNTMRQRITKADIIGLPAGVGSGDEDMRTWIEGHYAACHAHFSADPYFLDLDITSADAGERLTAALGVQMRWWGVVNDSDAREQRRKANAKASSPE